MEKLLTAEEVASNLGVHVKTLRLWTRKGLVRAQYLGKRIVRYRQSDVDAFLADRRQSEAV